MGVTVIKGHAAFFIFCIISKANHQAALNKYMNRLKKNQHTATFTSFKGCGKSILLLDLIERESITSTLTTASLYTQRSDRIRGDDIIWLTEVKGMLYQLIEKLPLLLAYTETLFIIGDIIDEKDLISRCNPF